MVREQVRRLLTIGILPDAQCLAREGRIGSAINLNRHFHCVFLEGVYLDRTEAGLKPRFVQGEPPSDTDIAAPLWVACAMRTKRGDDRQPCAQRTLRGVSQCCVACFRPKPVRLKEKDREFIDPPYRTSSSSMTACLKVHFVVPNVYHRSRPSGNQ